MNKIDSVPLKPVPTDVESIASHKDGLRDGIDDIIGIESEQIVSLYLQRQERAKSGDRFREYLQNNESVRATRRRQLFKRKEAVDEGREKVDYSQYKKRQCVTAIPKKSGSDRCGCNMLLTHPSHQTHSQLHPWNYNSHTKLEKTDAFGRVKFSSIQKAKYIRLDVETDSQQLADLVQNVFNLSTPGVIISVKGSLLGFSVTSKIEKIIQRGLIKAAITTNGWITTSGIDAGYVMSVGEALKMHNNTVPCIGFSSWGCLPEPVKEALTVRDGAELEKGEHICTYPKVKLKPGSAVENLEANHSHHILSDTGAIGDWGSESSLRARWEGYMRDVLNIPVVMVVMQGSLGAAEFLCKGLRSGTPAVVVFGSGGVCDVLVNLVRHNKQLAKKADRRSLLRQSSFRRSTPEEATTEICNCAEALSLDCPVANQFLDDGNFQKFTRRHQGFLDNVYEIVTQHEQLLILFDVEDAHYDGLDAALLEALVKAQNVKDAKNNDEDVADRKSMNLSGVQVALGWNRPDFAERLLKADTSAKDDIALGSILIHALAWNLHEFTDMLLTHDASIPMVAANTVVLYNSSHNSDHLKRYVRYNMSRSDKEIKFDKDTIDTMLNQLFGNRHQFNSNVSNETDPYFELMLWAALSLYPEVAELMWRSTQEPIRAALVVVMVLKKLSKANKVIINANEKDTLRQITARFEELAINILDNLKQVDSTVCERALNSGWARLNNVSYIDMAFRCKARDFIAHPACQEISERRWKRGLTSEVNVVSVFLVTLCPLFLLSNLITFRTEYTRANNPALRFFKRCKAYLKSPSVKFWFSVECYMAFLVYSTYIVLLELGRTQHPISVKKIIYFAWFGMMVLDEIIELVSSGHVKDWARNAWNKVDTIMYLFNLIGIILVHIPNPGNSEIPPKYDESCYNIGRIFLSMALIAFYVRLLHMFTIDSTLGPTILMIQKMLHDFKVFLLMFLIVAIAFGVGYAVALTDPESFEDTDKRGSFTVGIFFYTAFQMYGELFVEDLSSEDSMYFSGDRPPVRNGFVIVLVGVYMAIVMLMMVNLLIAMFSDTYTRIKDREDVIFKYQRLELLLETEHAFLAAPFSVLHFMIHWGCTWLARDRDVVESNSKDNKWKDTVIRSAVVDSLEDYLKKERSLKGSETATLVKDSTRLLKSKMYKLQKYVENVQSSIDSITQLPELQSLAGNNAP